MHATLWRSSRAPTQHLSPTFFGRQCFHWTPRSRQAPKSEPSNTPETSDLPERANGESEVGGEDIERSKSIAGSARSKNGYNGTSGGRLSRARQRGSENGPVFISSSEPKVNGGLPAVEIPDWFLRTNVKLHEELSGSDSVHEEIHLKHTTTGNLIGSLPCYRETQQRDHRRVINSAEAPTNDSSTLPPNDHFTSSIVLAEIAASMRAGLSIPLSTKGHSFPAAKSNLILSCPFDGHVDHLEALIHVLAQDIKADVVTINAQDLSELAGEYLSDPQELETRENAWRNLAFDVQDEASRLQKLSEKANDANPMESDLQDVEELETSPRKTFTTSNAKAFGGISLYPVSNAGDIFKFAQSLKTIPQNYAGGPDNHDRLTSHSVGRMSSSSAIQWEDLKLSTLLESILEVNQTKRRLGNDLCPRREEGNAWKNPGSSDARKVIMEESSPVSYIDREMDAAEKFFQSITVKEGKSMFNLERLRCEQIDEMRQISGNGHGQLTSNDKMPLIVMIENFKALNGTFSGARVLSKLEKIIRQKRSEGIPIMIVGTSSEEHRVRQGDDFCSDIGNLQEEMENSLYRTIVVPFNYERSDAMNLVMPPLDEMADLTFVGSSASDVQRVVGNARSLTAMCKRVNADLTPLSLQDYFTTDVPLCGNILDFNDAHRLCIIARGLSKSISAEKMLPEQFIAAFALLLWSDKIKTFWVAKEKERRNALLEDVKTMNPRLPHPKTPSNVRMKSLEKTATHHEKRLLSGVIDSRNLTTTFSSVQTSPRVIEALKTLTSLSLTRPDAFTYGVLASSKIPGLLLYGPPGTGKTLLAKAVARESGATMLEVSGGDIYDMYVGEGEKNVKAMFSLARKLSPCVVFIDEADAIFRTRGGERSATSHREIINQFLREWDGMNDIKESVFIMVATNRPFDLDDAVLRRLPRRLLVDLPTQKDREAILGIHLEGEVLDQDVDLVDIARRTPLYSGSDLKNLCVAAALACVREENEHLQHQQQRDTNSSGSESMSQSPNADAKSMEHVTATSRQPAEQFQLPQRRTLRKDHFNRAMEEIGASVSEDMSSLNAMKQFDEKYGDRHGRKSRRAWGFGMGEGIEEMEKGARVRK